MYTLNNLIDKACNDLLSAGFSEKTIYGAYWYIWYRLVKKHGKDAIFEESMWYYVKKKYQLNRNFFYLTSTFEKC